MIETKADIPYGQGHDLVDVTDRLTELPGDWKWSTVNRVELTEKVNVFFGLNSAETGGVFGVIDNWVDEDGQERWTIYTRPIVDVPGEDRNPPRAEAETAEDVDTLEEGIPSVPEHVETHYR